MIDTKLLEYIEFKYNININKFRYEEDNIIAFYNDTVPTMWDYNFIYFKKNPNLLKLIEISNKEKVNNEKHNKNFLKVIFEINAILPQEISDYYENLGLNCEEISFMTIDKYCLSTWKKYNDLKIILVNNAELLDKHINFCYENDFKISKEYAENRKN